jgi:hypothetical protein
MVPPEQRFVGGLFLDDFFKKKLECTVPKNVGDRRFWSCLHAELKKIAIGFHCLELYSIPQMCHQIPSRPVQGGSIIGDTFRPIDGNHDLLSQ